MTDVLQSKSPMIYATARHCFRFETNLDLAKKSFEVVGDGPICTGISGPNGTRISLKDRSEKAKMPIRPF